MNNHYAIFDYLSISVKLQGVLKNFSEYEIQLFAYLSCLLSLFKKRNVSEWEYSFVATGFGAPYSSDIGNVNRHFIETGLVDYKEDEYMELSPIAIDNYESMLSLYM